MHFERLLYLIPYCCSLEDLEALGNFMIFESVAFCQGLGLPAIVQGMFESRRPGEPRALTHKGHITTRHHSASRARGSPVANS